MKNENAIKGWLPLSTALGANLKGTWLQPERRLTESL
jgi:hypothetical protein